MRNVPKVYGSISEDKTVIDFDQSKFLESNAHLVVVCEKDELEDILKWDDACNIDNDAVLLLNSRRLDFADPKTVADIVRRRFSDKSVSSPFDGMDDNMIFANIKGRHIQSYSELDNYCEYLSAGLSANLSVSQIEEKKEIENEVSE